MDFRDLTIKDVEDLESEFNISFSDPETLKKPTIDFMLALVNKGRKQANLEPLTKETAKYTALIEDFGNFFAYLTPKNGTSEP